MSIFLGIDLGSSSIKVSVFDGLLQKEIASGFAPKQEMEIIAVQKGWAEQDPETWISYIKECIIEIGKSVELSSISAIGISYQMHGLVCVNKDCEVLRPAIIWCDSRAVETGQTFLPDVGAQQCFDKSLNLPGNFTISKLKWIEQNEPENYKKIYKFMLPGDYVAMRLSGEISTTVSGLSEGIAWDFKEHKTAHYLFDAWGLNSNMIPEVFDNVGKQAKVSQNAAQEFGLKQGTLISYRAGDQPNNALSLGAVNAGDFVATAGTSGVVYGVTDTIATDEKSRVNVFAHVNHSKEHPHLGILMCINGCAILNNWAQSNWATENLSYEEMNSLAATINVGSDGLLMLPFGNGAERIYENQDIGASLHGLQFNIHTRAHLYRAVQEGIAFSFKSGFDIIEAVFDAKPKVIKAGTANLFLSDVFSQTVTNLLNIPIELYDTNGALGAARGAAIGTGFYATYEQAFEGLEMLKKYEPEQNSHIHEVYENWKKILDKNLDK